MASRWFPDWSAIKQTEHDDSVRADDDELDESPETDYVLSRRVAEALTGREWTVATAESLTGGRVTSDLSAVEGASDWFLGGLVAYAEEVKFRLLGVNPGPVITAETALQMAVGATKLLGADVAVATTGVGGPGPQEGKPQGTVYIAVCTPEARSVSEYHLSGDPPDVVAGTSRRALRDLAAVIDSAVPTTSGKVPSTPVEIRSDDKHDG